MTSICHGWGTTRKASLRAIYDFMRYKFTREVEDPDDSYKKIWQEVFPVKIWGGEKIKFKVESGTGSSYFKVMYVTHEDAVYTNPNWDRDNTAGVSLSDDGSEKNIDNIPFDCDTNIGNASYYYSNTTCVDINKLEYKIYYENKTGTPCNNAIFPGLLSCDTDVLYVNDGKLDIYTDDDFEVSLYDFHAFEMVGKMYDKFLGCAVRIFEIFYKL